jgi:hypothetical protein
MALMRLARSCETTRDPALGLRPSSARKRPARASWQQLIAMAHWWK